VIRAELIGDACSALGITVAGIAPILKLCRRLVETGHDPNRPLSVFRNGALALVIRSIGEAAQLEVSPRGSGFVRHPGVRAGPPVRQITKAATGPRREIPKPPPQAPEPATPRRVSLADLRASAAARKAVR
jgi:hypothetical protein